MTQSRRSDSKGNKQNPSDSGRDEPEEERQHGVTERGNNETEPNARDHQQEAHYHPRDWFDRLRVGLLLGTLIAAVFAAVFTGSQAYIAGDTARRQLRAYVYAAPSHVFHIDGKGTLQGYVEIGNSGQTFAREVQRWVGISVFGAEVPDRKEDLGPTRREEGVLVINPSVRHIVIRNHKQLTDEEARKIRTNDGSMRIYVFGTIRYKDIYGEPHHTDFCHMYFGTEFWPHSSGPAYNSTQGKYCDKHNDAD